MRLYIVSRNQGKIRELSYLSREHGIDLVPLDIPKVEVQSESIQEVALYSATVAYLTVRKPVIVEDSGLYIKKLKMFPGALSSYVYKTIGIHGILKLMEGVRDRDAVFKSVIALAAPRVRGVKLFQGVVYGTISEEPRGTGGFGFDPIFIPSGYTKTFAEMSIEEKNKVSHRAKAFRGLAEWLIKNCGKLLCHDWK
ncbi:MAG: XTP/dITP diphosphatase [Sulfolobales archaeon]